MSGAPKLNKQHKEQIFHEYTLVFESVYSQAIWVSIVYSRSVVAIAMNWAMLLEGSFKFVPELCIHEVACEQLQPLQPYIIINLIQD